jgi:hypothetical protein
MGDGSASLPYLPHILPLFLDDVVLYLLFYIPAYYHFSYGIKVIDNGF